MDDFSSEFFDSNGLNDIGWPLAITGTEIQPSFTANADSYIAPDLPSDLIGGVEPGSLDDLAFDFEGMFDRPPAGQFEPPLFVVSQNAPQPTEPTLDIPAVHAGRSRRAKARGPTALSWSRQKSNIKKLYIDEDKTLEETRKLMETRHGFSATPQMYKEKLGDWGFSKNISKKIAAKLCRMADERKPKDTIFYLGQKNWSVDEMKRKLERGGKEDPLLELGESPVLPVELYWRTPSLSPSMRDGVLARKTPTPPSNNPWLSPVLRQEASLPQILDRRPPWIPSISNILHPSSGPWRPSSSPVRGSSATFHSTHLHLPQTLPPVFPWTASSNIRNDPLNDFVTKSKWEGKSLRDLQELRLQSLEVASTGKFDQAIPKLRTVVMGLQYLLAPTHEYTAVATYDLAKILGDNNEMNEADAVLNWINRSIVKKYGLRSEVAVMHYLKVVELLRSWLREEDAELLMYKVAELWNQQNTDEVPTMPGSTLAFAPPTTVPEADIKLLFRDPIKTEDDVHIQIRFIEILLPLRTASQLDLEDIGRNILGYCEENELLIPLLRARSCLSKIYESRSMNERATEILDGALPAIQHHLHVSETIDQPVLRSCRELAFRYLDLDNRRKCEDLLEMAADFFEMRVPESQRSQTAINYLISIGCEWQRRLSWKAAAPWFERAFLSSIKHLGESHCKTKLLEKTLEHEHFVLQGQHILEFELQHASL